MRVKSDKVNLLRLLQVMSFYCHQLINPFKILVAKRPEKPDGLVLVARTS